MPSTEESRYQGVVISWNLTRRCNLECQHCYIDAGLSRESPEGELTTGECLAVIDQLAEQCPEALLILTGGEPLLRRDVFAIAGHATTRGFWVVVGTNGVLVDERVINRLKEAGVRGVSLSLDSLDPAKHDLFRGVRGAWKNTVEGSDLLRRRQLPFIIQTTLHKNNLSEVEAIARKAHELGARVFNLYFLVSTGRGAYVSDVTPEDYERVMHRLIPLQKEFTGKMLINAKCAPHYQRVLYETDPDSPYLKTFSLGAGGCPAGTHYLGIAPDGNVSPCPYLPVYGGNLKEEKFKDIWNKSDVFTKIRQRETLGGRCGPCEFNATCGGCRARAFGKTGNFMAEDPWCVYEPGRFGGKPISFETIYGSSAPSGGGEIAWTAEAKERLKNVPAFVRGMVAKSIEEAARREGRTEITGELMDRIREKVGKRFLNAPSFSSPPPSESGSQ
jgi:AdoMet-dependent heme synthase